MTGGASRPEAAEGLEGTIRPGQSTLDTSTQGQSSQGDVSQSVGLDELANASPGTLRRRYLELQAQLKVAKKQAMTIEQRNRERQKRRQAGEKEVSDDEEDSFDIAVKKAVLLHAGTFNRAIASGASLVQLGGLGEGDKILFSENELVDRDRYTDDVPTPAAVVDLLRARVYIPLRVFVTDTLVAISRGDVGKLASRLVDGKKQLLLDTTPFTELDMTPADFYNAWRNLLSILETRSDPAVYHSMSKVYYARLVAHSKFSTHFSSFLRFDMDFRLKWFAKPFKFDDTVFARLGDFLAPDAKELKAQVEQAAEEAAQKAVQSALASVASSSRWTPYPAPSSSSSFAALPARPHSFRGSAGSSTSMFAGSCLVCGITGHKAAECVAKSHVDGGTLFAKWDGKKLVRLDNGGYICAAHNTRTCPRPNHDGHVCALCGSTAHSAFNATCRRRA